MRVEVRLSRARTVTHVPPSTGPVTLSSTHAPSGLVSTNRNWRYLPASSVTSGNEEKVRPSLATATWATCAAWRAGVMTRIRPESSHVARSSSTSPDSCENRTVSSGPRANPPPNSVTAVPPTTCPLSGNSFVRCGGRWLAGDPGPACGPRAECRAWAGVCPCRPPAPRGAAPRRRHSSSPAPTAPTCPGCPPLRDLQDLRGGRCPPFMAWRGGGPPPRAHL